MSNTYAIASAKGGVGKTTTVANLGVALAAAGTDAVVVDADVGMANLARTLGVTPDGATLHDVLAGTAALEDALYDTGRLTLLPGSEELADYRGADLSDLDEVLSTLAAEYDHVLVDTGAGLSHDTALPLEAVDEVVLVSTPQPQALGDTEKTRGLVERLGGSVAGLVVTRAAAEVTVDRVDADVIARIPDDPAVDESVLAGEPVVSFAPSSPAARAYREFTGDFFEVDVHESELDAADGAATADGSEGEVEGPGDTAESDAVEAATDETATNAATAAEAESTDGGESVATAESGGATDEAESTVREGSEEDETTTETAEPTEDGAPSSDASVDSNDQSTDEESRDEAEPKSVGPHRTEDVPVSEAEPDADAEPPETIAAELDDGDSDDADSGSASESKGFLSRLLGR